METRVCTFCGIEKPLTKTYFEKARERKDGSIALRAKCIECRRKDLYKWRKENPDKNKAHIKKWHDNNKEHTKKWREENKEHLDKYKENWRNENREYTREIAKEYREKNLDKIKDYKQGRGKEIYKIWREKNTEELKQKGKIYYKENKHVRDAYRKENREKLNKHRRESEKMKATAKKWRKEKIKSDPLFHLRINISTRLANALKREGYTKRAKRTTKLIGVDYKTLSEYIENQFTSGMSWENYGEWHVDHIIPLSSAETEAEMLALAYYKNLQPLWEDENLIKNANYDPKDKEEYLDWYSKNVAKKY
ncbi:hypothetical protein N9T08_00625 [Flavobacteriaceae bacterium]|nr:hypothetical protein [Flavobacteriaceae bacterium]